MSGVKFMKKSNGYDAVFKTMKVKHKRLFISVINEASAQIILQIQKSSCFHLKAIWPSVRHIRGKAIQERIKLPLNRIPHITALGMLGQ